MSTETSVGPVKALGILGAVIVVVAGFIGLTTAVGNHEAWAGFLFLLYWAMAEKMKPEALPKSIAGSLVGLGVASLLFLLPNLFGTTIGLLAALAVILVLIYVQIRGQALVAVNMATMIFLTVATIPHVQTHASFTQVLISLFMGIAYFGGLALAATWVARRRSTVTAAGAL